MNTKYSLAFQELLYRDPLFDHIGKTERNMNLLVIGRDEAAFAFLDQCLQAGQMLSHALHISVAGHNIQEAKTQYLAERPALPQFVNVDGSCGADPASDKKEIPGQSALSAKYTSAPEKCYDAYAILNFEELSESDEAGLLSGGSDAEEVLISLLSEAPDEKYHYFLISTGDDSRNKMLADALSHVVQVLMPSEKNSIYYIVTSDASPEDPSDVQPVQVNRFDSIADIDPELTRMAFNTDLCWEETINGDLSEKRKSFLSDSYRYLSSASYALSIKYKLAEFQIPMEDLSEAASAFAKVLDDGDNEDVLNQLICLEHRRWVLEKLTGGWTAPAQSKEYYRSILDRCEVNDKEHKIHPCIVRITTDTPLSTGSYSRDKGLWESGSSADSGLDELDRMSVELHRYLRSRAKEFIRKDPVRNGSIPRIRGILQGQNMKARALREWEQFVLCVENVLGGSRTYSRQYRLYEKRFLNILSECTSQAREEITGETAQLYHDIWPVIEANQFRDYKKNNDRLVKKSASS